jgi:hypothetical protein
MTDRKAASESVTGPMESRQSSSQDESPEVKWWVWTQHGDAQYIWAAGGGQADAVERFAEQRQVPFGTTIYVTNADNVAAFKVGAQPR